MRGLVACVGGGGVHRVGDQRHGCKMERLKLVCGGWVFKLVGSRVYEWRGNTKLECQAGGGGSYKSIRRYCGVSACDGRGLGRMFYGFFRFGKQGFGRLDVAWMT